MIRRALRRSRGAALGPAADRRSRRSGDRRSVPCVGVVVALALGACSGDPAIRVTGAADGDADEGSGGGAGPDVDAGVDVDAGETGGGEGVPGTGDPTGGTGVPPGVGDVTLPPGARAGAYVGRLDDGAGVFVLDSAGRLIGLGERADGSAASWVAEFGEGTASGPALRFAHASVDGGGEGASPLGVRAGDGPELELVAGERVAGVSGDVEVALEASGRADLAPVTRASLAGRWSGGFRDCDSLGEHCSELRMTIDVDGLALSGASGVFTADDTDLFPVPMRGELVPLGDFAEIVFEWNTYDYAGVVHFVPGAGDRLVVIGYTDRELADHPVVAAVLGRAPGG